jgi:hypothetical protein
MTPSWFFLPVFSSAADPFHPPYIKKGLWIGCDRIHPTYGSGSEAGFLAHRMAVGKWGTGRCKGCLMGIICVHLMGFHSRRIGDAVSSWLAICPERPSYSWVLKVGSWV